MCLSVAGERSEDIFLAVTRKRDKACQILRVICRFQTLRAGLGWRFVQRHRWLYRGEHVFRLEDAGDGTTRLIDSERFWGLLVPFRRRALHERITASMTRMGTALKEWVESHARGTEAPAGQSAGRRRPASGPTSPTSAHAVAPAGSFQDEQVASPAEQTRPVIERS